MAKKKPSVNGENGRDPRGRFTRGNAGGPGNPHAKRVAEFRNALLERVKTTDVEEVIDELMKLAKGGDIIAIREFLNRVIGKSVAMDLLQRIEALEQSKDQS